MEYHCGNYLNQYKNRNDIQPSYNHNSDKAMIIVETRCSYWLPLVIRNAVDKLKGWNLYVFGNNEVIDLVTKEVGGTFIPVNIGVPKLTIPMYNNLLTSIPFWDKIKETHALIFQIDCIIFREPTQDMLKWDYIGPVCGMLDENRFIMNGGLSLRNTLSSRVACSMMTAEDLKKPEDVAFTEIMRKSSMFKIPSMEECLDFGIESIGNIKKAVGLHGTDKYYMQSYEKLFVNDK